jgi:hypothetical protein
MTRARSHLSGRQVRRRQGRRRGGIRGWRGLVACSLLSMQLPALGWSDHATLLWPLLRGMPELLQPRLNAQPLEHFIAADPEALQRLLAEHESYARRALPHYAPRPDALAFDPGATDLRLSFLRAIRVNPLLEYGLYRQQMPGEPELAAGTALVFARLSFLSSDEAHEAVRYSALRPGESVSPAQVIATASDEPDFGMDVGLFEDNGTAFGRDYGFGAQPFGNANLEYSSQAPFHMGFYHLDWLLRIAQPSVQLTYPDWRVSLFQRLAEYAFENGQDYWGWRFMGWALHYIGDLTQPYHADPLPGISSLDVMWTLARGTTAEAVQLLSNRHGVLESYQYQRLRTALREESQHPALLQALAAPRTIGSFDSGTLKGELTARSVAAADALDAALAEHVPARYVSDPEFEWTGSGEEAAIVASIRATGGEEALAALDAVLVIQLRRFSRYAAAWIAQAQAQAR